MFGPNWPYQGEIDIIEGVHEQDHNALTLHTSTGCAVSQDTSIFAGKVATANCDVKAQGQADNAGCSIGSEDNKSYGAGLNDNGGGVYATEWTSDAISIWFFPRGSVPDGVTGDNPDPSSWGKPTAKWVKDSCDIDGIFKDLNIIFDTTFCGDWAGNTWSSSSCASKAATCNDYVRDNPDAFTNAFWTINALKVYQQGDAPAAQPEQPAPSAPAEQPAPSAPVEQPAPSAPVEQPASSVPVEQPAPSAPVEQPAPSAPVESQPAAPVESQPAAPVESGAPVMQNPDGTINIPLGPWGSNGEGGGNGGDDGAENGIGADTNPSILPAPASGTPLSTAAAEGPASTPIAGAPASAPAGNGGGFGGFNWPGAPQGTAAPSGAAPVISGAPVVSGAPIASGAAPIPSFGAGNATGYPVLPSGTGASDVAEVWETIFTTQVVTVPGVGPAPTAAPPADDGSNPIATVQSTIYQTVMVTVNGGANTLPTQAPAAPIAREARRQRSLRRRMVQHNRA